MQLPCKLFDSTLGYAIKSMTAMISPPFTSLLFNGIMFLKLSEARIALALLIGRLTCFGEAEHEAALTHYVSVCMASTSAVRSSDDGVAASGSSRFEVEHDNSPP